MTQLINIILTILKQLTKYYNFVIFMKPIRFVYKNVDPERGTYEKKLKINIY